MALGDAFNIDVALPPSLTVSVVHKSIDYIDRELAIREPSISVDRYPKTNRL